MPGRIRLRVVEADQTRARRLVGRLPQPRVTARQRDLAGDRGHPVAEAAVDHLLRGPQRRDRLASLTDVLELGAHHGRQDAATAMRRQDSDHGDATAGNDAAGHGQLEGEGSGAADDRVPVEGSVHPLERQHPREPLGALLVRAAAEVVGDRADSALELLEILGRTHIPGHSEHLRAVRVAGRFGRGSSPPRRRLRRVPRRDRRERADGSRTRPGRRKQGR